MGFILGLILGIVGTVAVIAAFAFFSGGEESVDEHEHDYRIVGAHQMFNVKTIRGIQIQRTEEGEPITEVLYRCACDEVYTDTLTGHWTLKQLSSWWADEPEEQTTPTEEFCGFESLHEAHEWINPSSPVKATAEQRHCPGSFDLTLEEQNASRGRSDAMAGGDNPDAAKDHSNN
jgi:hypothetical protein